MIQKTISILFLLSFIIPVQSQAQTERDTVFYDIEPEMIAQVRMEEDQIKEDSYRILVLLKKEYHSEFEQLTRENIDNFLGVTQNGEILSPALPVIKAKISGGRFSLLFSDKEEASQVLDRITGKEE